MNISSVFEKILQNPVLHLGASSITRLWAYLRGYMMALEESSISYDDKEFDKFAKWIDEKFHLRTTNSWAEIVLFVSCGDEHRAIEITKELWLEFKNESNINERLN